MTAAHISGLVTVGVGRRWRAWEGAAHLGVDVALEMGLWCQENHHIVQSIQRRRFPSVEVFVGSCAK